MSGREVDRDYIIAASTELDDYLSSAVLFWPLKKNAKKLTPGNLLLALTRIRAFSSSAEWDETLSQAVRLVEHTIHTRRSAWKKKSAEELVVRLRLWKAALEEILEDGMIDGTYPAQITNRVLIDLLRGESTAENIRFEHELEIVDEMLRPMLRDGGFVWDAALESSFPRDKFWYLYQGDDEVLI